MTNRCLAVKLSKLETYDSEKLVTPTHAGINITDSMTVTSHRNYPILTSNMTGRHQGLKQKLRQDIGMLCAVSHMFTHWMITMLPVTNVIFFIIECGTACFLCAQRKHAVPHSMMKNMTCVTGSIVIIQWANI